MPREPRLTSGHWSPTAVLVETADPLPGAGMLWVFDAWDPAWWPAAANDE